MTDHQPYSRQDGFLYRHVGPNVDEQHKMLSYLGCRSLEHLIDQTVPPSIRSANSLDVGEGLCEDEALLLLRSYADKNKLKRTFIGQGYYSTHTPEAIKRHLLENPGWYTQYTPYQAEISQGRMEALLNFQTMCSDLTGLEIANASLLDEATAAAEAMALSLSAAPRNAPKNYFVDENLHPQSIEVLKTRAAGLGVELIIASSRSFDFSVPVFGAVVQYPDTFGRIVSYEAFAKKLKDKGAVLAVGCDLLSLCLLKPPGEFGAEIAFGSAQRFGVPLGYGGPHAAFFATSEKHKRRIPGRIIGVSKDAHGKLAYRLALQTREQHIRREKATSNICTAQALLASMASMYAVYHGPKGLKAIASRVHLLASMLADELSSGASGSDIILSGERFFDTVSFSAKDSYGEILARAEELEINLRADPKLISISLDETTGLQDVADLVYVCTGRKVPVSQLEKKVDVPVKIGLERTSSFLTHPVFNTHHSETALLRYMKRLEDKDLSLTTSMIPLGSCTMKLNAAAELAPVSWPLFAGIHPFVPQEQAEGYKLMIEDLSKMLCSITGFSAASMQPNSGAQGEYAGLLVIDAFHKSRGEGHRKVCLIPRSAHGTNPASAAMAGMKIVIVDCDEAGNIDVKDLVAKAEKHADELSCLMITYPSTHGVFEKSIVEVTQVIHRLGGQVYMDGANLNAQVGVCRPVDFGADVCHMNLHKTFCIPHGGGGPGMGPIAVASHLAEFLPGHFSVKNEGNSFACGSVSAAPYGSPLILPISWMYIKMMGAAGLQRATEVAILNANYLASRLEPHYPVLYKGEHGRVAHECIIDLRPLKKSAGTEVDDIAKRLIDYGFHAPTVSFPVAGTMMIEPTESENLAELDRFCEAMICIRQEIAEIESGGADVEMNVLKNAPHTAAVACADEWPYPYRRSQAVFPLSWVQERKFWPSVGRVDNAYGDRNLLCSCPSIENYES